MPQAIRVLHITPHVGRASFGIGPIVLSLAATQQHLGHIVNIWCYDTPEEARSLEKFYSLREGTIRLFPILGPKRLGYSPLLEDAIVEQANLFDIVHQHGIWTGVSRAVVRWKNQTNGATVIAPHGSLEPYALRKSRWKKHLALLFYESQNLYQVDCMHALSNQELDDFRRFGLNSSVAIIPNGISSMWVSQQCDAISFREQYDIEEKTQIMLFLGRITPKKGLPMLLKAMNTQRALLNNWVLMIAGVDEFNHQKEVRELINKLSLQPFVKFVGSQYDQAKRDAFCASAVFVLTSHSEGAPVTILEALGAGVPVLTTKASPWEELLTSNCGWWTDISIEAIADALQDILHQTPATLQEMGQRGRQLVGDNYTWIKITERTIALYEWLLSRGRQPSFVYKE
jgi:glycosyltransferase involved in cell wall biosynthesis